MTTDNQLLFRYIDADDQEAFAELVRRHVNWINSMAARLTHDRALADDVTQAVFLLLAKKAGSLRRQIVLSTWLFTVTRYASSTAMRKEMRRREHERKAAHMHEEIAHPIEAEADWQQLSPLLDQLVSRLRNSDRQAVLLRFYEQKSFSEIGQALQISEEAARKRVTRSIDKLRDLFTRKGVTVGAATLTATLSASLSESASASVIAASTAQASAAATLTPLAQGAGTSLMWGSIKPIAAIVGSILITAAATTALLQLRAQPSSAAGPATAPAVVADGSGYSGRVVDPDGKSLAGAQVILVNSDAATPRTAGSTKTDANGNFALVGAGNDMSIFAFAEGFGLTGVDLATEPPSAVEIKIRKHSNVLAHFDDPQGKPAAGVRVAVSEIFDSRQRWQVRIPEEIQLKQVQVTDAQGDCTFEGIPENSIVRLDVLDSRYVKLQSGQSPQLMAINDTSIWVGPSGIARSEPIKLELAGEISGIVTHAETNAPAANVALIFQPQPLQTGRAGGRGSIPPFVTTTAITDARGSYHRPQLRPGEYMISLESSGEIGARSNTPAVEHVVVESAKQTASQDFKLAAGGILRGRVVANGRGVANVRLAVAGPASPMNIESMRTGRFGQPLRTADDGSYEFHVPPGEQTISLVFPLPEGFATLTEDNPVVSIEAGQTINVNDFELRADPAATVTGRVIDAAGNPVAGARVVPRVGNLWSAPMTGRGLNSARAGAAARKTRGTVTDADGRFVLSNALPQAELRAEKGELISAVVPVPADNSPITFRLDASSFSTVAVKVQDREGSPIHDAKVMLNVIAGRGGARGQFFTAMGTGEGMVTGANGMCIFDKIDPSLDYTFNVSANGFANKSALTMNNDVKLTPGQRTDMNIVMARTDSFVGGIVLDENLKPKAGVAVILNGGKNITVTTDANGRFHAQGVVEDSFVSAQVQRGDPTQRMQTLSGGRDDNLLIDRPLATIARGVDVTRAAPRDGSAHRPEETEAANAITALGGTATNEAQRGDAPVTRVALARATPTDEQIKPIAQFKSLENLSVPGLNITDASMTVIGNLPELTSLLLANSKITDAGIKPLKQLRFLQTLNISASAISDQALVDIGQMQVLTSLNLSNTKITDAGLKSLAPLKYLYTFNLSNTRISDQGLQELKGIRSLRALDLRGTQVTDAGVGELQNALPGLKITR